MRKTVAKRKDHLLPDQTQQNAEGTAAPAKTVHQDLTAKLFAENNPLAFESEWNGHKMHEFEVANRSCKLVFPEQVLPGNPWIWRTEFFGAFPSVDIALVSFGYHVAYMDVSGMFGAPKALNLMDFFYDYLLSHYGLHSKTVLEGFSRGGLFALNWAIRHPDKISSIYLDAPVCDFKSWPAGEGRSKKSPSEWEACLDAYGFGEEEALVYAGNPVDNLTPLATAKLPILAVYGDADKTVVPEENILAVEKRYKKMGGEISLIVKSGVDHHPHSLENPQPIVDFIISRKKS